MPSRSDLRIAVIGNLWVNRPWKAGEPPDAWDDLDSEHTALNLLMTFREVNYRCQFFEGNLDMIPSLRAYNPHIAFNFSEGYWGSLREVHIYAILEMMGIPYVGTRGLDVARTFDKEIAKRLMVSAGIPTPPFTVFDEAELPQYGRPVLHYPLIVKPVREGSSIGITPDSIARDADELTTRVQRVLRLYKQPALVEEFIPGKEVTVGVVGSRGLDVEILPPLEFRLGGSGIYDRDAKNSVDFYPYQYPSSLSSSEVESVLECSRKLVSLFGIRDFGRFDFRVAPNGSVYCLELNPLPFLRRGYSEMGFVFERRGGTYEEMLLRILESALYREGLL